MEISQLDPETVRDCVRETALGLDMTEQQLLSVLETQYPGITELYSSATSKANLFSLPTELNTMILSNLTPNSLLSIGRSNKLLAQQSRDPALWRQLLERDWGETDYQGSKTQAGKYFKLQNKYILHTDAQQIALDLQTTLLEGLPSTAAMELFRRLCATYPTFQTDTGYFVDTTDHEFGSEVEPGKIQGVLFAPTVSIPHNDPLFTQWDRMWCSNTDKQLWFDGFTNSMREQMLTLYPGTEYEFGYDNQSYIDDNGALVVGVRVWLRKRRYETGTSTSIPSSLLPSILLQCRQHLVATADTSKESPEDTEKLRGLIENQSTMILYGQSGNANTVAYTLGDAVSPIVDIRVVRFKVYYSTRLDSLLSRAVSPQCRYQDTARQIQRRIRLSSALVDINTVITVQGVQLQLSVSPQSGNNAGALIVQCKRA